MRRRSVRARRGRERGHAAPSRGRVAPRSEPTRTEKGERHALASGCGVARPCWSSAQGRSWSAQQSCHQAVHARPPSRKQLALRNTAMPTAPWRSCPSPRGLCAATATYAPTVIAATVQDRASGRRSRAPRTLARHGPVAPPLGRAPSRATRGRPRSATMESPVPPAITVTAPARASAGRSRRGAPRAPRRRPVARSATAFRLTASRRSEVVP